MGKVRTRKVKVYAKDILEKFPSEVSHNFEENKRLVGIALRGQVSKKLRNRVAGYLTALAKKLEEKQKKEAEAMSADTNNLGVKEGNI
ncbi:MAG: 30S ribosomal protein S17e [Nitrososphaerota archaeon]